jgi:uncharacterized protein involved in response to NO
MTNVLNSKSYDGPAQPKIAFLEFAFRPFFLLASLFSIIALLVWNGVLTGGLTLNLYGGALWWHMHEMLFGFAAAIIVGFLLTAVQNWTSVRSLNGMGLLVLVFVWLTARVLFFFPDSITHWLIAIVDIAFLPLATIFLAYPIIKAKKWKNLIFIPILLMMTLVNITMHYAVASQDYQLISNVSTVMVLLVTLVMCIMGGRVFPMFTANGTRTARTTAIAWLENVVISSTLMAVLLTVLISFNVIDLPSILIAAIFFVAAVANAVRAFRWKIWVTFKTPLVWSLHLSYWCIVIGLLMYGLSEITTVVTHSQAIHSLTVGGIGVMILSMISRVSLGHTGRNIVVGKVMTIALIALILAFISRVFVGYWVSNYSHALSMAVGFWVIGYGCFVVLYFPILTKPRMR